MMVPGRLRVQVGYVGRPLWGRFDPFATPSGNGRFLRIPADGVDDVNRSSRIATIRHNRSESR